MNKLRGQLDCVMCGHSCGYRSDVPCNVFYEKNESVPDGVEVIKTEKGYELPVDQDNVCIYLEKLDNGFTRCGIHDKKPRMCKAFYCLPQHKVRQLQVIIEELKTKFE